MIHYLRLQSDHFRGIYWESTVIEEELALLLFDLSLDRFTADVIRADAKMPSFQKSLFQACLFACRNPHNAVWASGYFSRMLDSSDFLGSMIGYEHMDMTAV